MSKIEIDLQAVKEWALCHYFCTDPTQPKETIQQEDYDKFCAWFDEFFVSNKITELREKLLSDMLYEQWSFAQELEKRLKIFEENKVS